METVDTTVASEPKLVLMRFMENLPEWGLLFPIGGALVVLFLVLFFLQRDKLTELLHVLFIPPVAVVICHGLWGLYLLAYFAGIFAAPFFGLTLDTEQYVYGALPLLAYPVLLALLATLVMCVRQPLLVLPIGLVVAVCGVYFGLGLVFLSYFTWWLVLVPMLLVGLVYIFMMYLQDAKTIHPLIAIFLGMLRATVYAILAVVFLLPGLQEYDVTETHSKVLVLFDVSDSMLLNKDDLPKPGQNPSELLTRQDKVLGFLTALRAGDANAPVTFLDQIAQKSPSSLLRFGAVVDQHEILQLIKGQKVPTKEVLSAWLKPERSQLKVPTEVNGKKLDAKEYQDLTAKLHMLYDDLRSGTNISGAALQAVIRETSHKLQAVIIFTDGQSNLGSDDSMRELLLRAGNIQRPIHLIVVGVGKYRQEVGIRIDDIQAPQQVRPDDKFPVRVPVVGDGLREKEFTVHLDITRVVKKGDTYETIPDFQKTLTEKGVFKGSGDHPFAEVEFQIHPRELQGVGPLDESQDDKIEGLWQFKARVPRDPGEAFDKAEHESKTPRRVLVQKRKLRVLLFAGGPTREYQFVRTLFYREKLEKRLEMSVYLQTGGKDDVDQDVDAEHLLQHFPDRLTAANPKEKQYGFNEYDVIIAFDPDWTRLDVTQLNLLKRWVGGPSAGGLIFIAGPVNTYQIARPGGMDLSALTTIMPVVLKDSRLHSLGIGHDASRPYALNLASSAALYDFLKLEEDKDESASKGWEHFFWEGTKQEAGKEAIPMRGFYNYYPVEKVKPATEVLATFAGPIGSRINDGKDEMPFLATMAYGPGKTIYLGAGETWRLRLFKESYHQRFWVKLARFAASGNLNKLSKNGIILAQSRASIGTVNIEAQILGDDGNPLDRGARPEVVVVRPADFDAKADRDTPEKFELKAKSTQGDWNGWFSGTFRVRTAGDYTLKIAVPGSTAALAHDITIYKPDPEKDNRRPNEAYNYQLATSAQPILKRLEQTDKKKRELLQKILQPPAREEGKSELDTAERIRLYFPLEYAHLVPDCLVEIPPAREEIKGRFQSLWDQGVKLGAEVRFDVLLLILLPVLGFFAMFMLALRQQWIALIATAAVTFLLTVLVLGVSFLFAPDWLRWTAALGGSVNAYTLLLVAPTAVGLLAVLILAYLRNWVGAGIAAGLTVLSAIAVLGADVLFQPAWADMPLNMSFVLGSIVTLLAIEWLTRKLLRLA